MVELLPNGSVRFAFLHATDQTVCLVGDFNDWDECSHPMERRPDSTHCLELLLRPGEYEYKFKVGSQWYNDDFAHKYVPNPWGSENSVVVVPTADSLSPQPAHTLRP
ncbi:MAG TPA: isoamylase early set domain-containing protein [Candidatus Saccharimonadales bacterium]|nr:isoamylase early set domain-containing protein [Candidatus Saccharimonadales bacterium]